jgi:hypothetical protein
MGITAGGASEHKQASTDFGDPLAIDSHVRARDSLHECDHRAIMRQ